MAPARPPGRPPSDRRCPICRRAVAPDGARAPFCSERCKMVDLGRWFRGEYAVAGETAVALDPDAGGEGGPPESEA